MNLTTVFSDPIGFVLFFVSLVICITIHEFAHAYVADKLGDPTAKLAGRVTLNPFSHLDPIGTLALVFFHFGWGRPVPFDPYNLKDPKRDSALISIAGPLSNLGLAVIISIVLHVFPIGQGLVGQFLVSLLVLNVGLAIFNLIPIHPLDGGKILIGLAPKEVAKEWDSILHNYGIFILLLLFLPLYQGTSPLVMLLNPIISTILKVLLF